MTCVSVFVMMMWYFLCTSSEKLANFVRCEEWNHLFTRLEFIGDVFE